MATLYSDRFDPQYLDFLSQQLELRTLTQGAIKERKRDQSGKYVRCIQINYCGIAANTLLGNATFARGMTTDSLISAKRVEIARKFKELFSPSTLTDLSDRGYYLKVRFCFAYVYSDFPVSLVEAEDQANWEVIKDGTKYNYHYTRPLTYDTIQKSSIYNSQVASLHLLKTLCQRAASDGFDLATWDKEKHSIHIRFTVLPSPTCLMFINHFALCDAYLYGMLQDEKAQLMEGVYEPVVSLHYPVSIISKDDPKDCYQFLSLQNHFKYLWRHELTLFCGDGTKFNFEERNVKEKTKFNGLTEITPPGKVEWKDKIHRIAKSKERNHLPQRNWFYVHLYWKPRLTRKFKSCTSKVISASFFDRITQNMRANFLLAIVSSLLMIAAFLAIAYVFDANILKEVIRMLNDHLISGSILIAVLVFAQIIIRSLATVLEVRD